MRPIEFRRPETKTLRLRWLAISPQLLLLLLGLLSFSGRCALDFDLNLPPPPEQLEQFQQLERPFEPLELLPGSRSESAPALLPARVAPPPPPKVPARQANKKSWVQKFKDRTKEALEHARSRLPKYFDFQWFAKNFNRKYLPGELFYRKSVFLKRCLEVFRSRVAFRMGQTSYVQGINRFADRSPNELKRMYMSGPPIEFRPAGQTESEYYAELARTEAERMRPDTELESRASLSELGGAQASRQEDEVILHESQAAQRVEELLNSEDPLVVSAAHEELAALDGESLSQACLGGCTADQADQSQNQSQNQQQQLPRPFQQSPDASERPSNGSGQAYKPAQLEADEFLDWSEHECLHTVYDQGENCGKCYVMASTALAEFYKCSDTSRGFQPRKFSKDYVLACAQKYKPTILGCTGGSVLDTLGFIGEAGIFSIRNWKLRRETELAKLRRAGASVGELDLRCPLNKFELPLEKWGEIRVNLAPEPVGPNEWRAALLDGPLVASVQMPLEGVATYQGGVHQGEGCAHSGNWHSMLLVGFGTNHLGLAYWRFRNSWGKSWGEQGHFNLAMSVPGECLAGGVRVRRRRANDR